MMLLGNINAIPFRRRLGGGGGTPFPHIPGMIARYSGAGLTNEDMATNPVWKDLTGNGHDLQMKNFAWKGMSGVNGYVENFNQYFVGFDESNKTVSDSSMKLVLLESDSQKVIYDKTAHQIGYTYNFYIKVTGIEGRTLNVKSGTLGNIIMSITEDGIYSINTTISDDWGNNMLYLIFPPSSSNNTVTIEQLPLYPGALVFDGVDDYGICDNFPILTKEKGYTVVALRQWITRGGITSGLISNVKNWFADGAFVLEYCNTIANYSNNPMSFGAITGKKNLPHILTYQTSKSYNGASITTGKFTGTDVLWVGKLALRDVGICINAAIWEICILDHDATEEELQKIQDYYKQEYPWLFPDQAWTVVGKTNEDEDRATIANITGNGNNLVLSNFGFAENSGYGLYTYNFNLLFTNQHSKNATFTVTSQTIHITESKRAGVNFAETAKSTSIKPFKIRVTGIQPGQEIKYRGSADIYGIVEITTDGIYDIPLLERGEYMGFQFSSYVGSCDITIEQIPYDYEGYLVTDGVDDIILSSAFTVGKDFTVVGEWKYIDNANNNSGIRKVNSFIVRNNDSGLSLFLNRNTQAYTIFGTKSLKAICSNGILYKEDWTQEVDNTPQFL